MNPLPPNADELVSAYLDDEATPDEIATVESTPELLARVDSLRALTSGLSSAITPPPAQKEAHLSAALDAFDAMFADTTSGDTGTTEPQTAAPSLTAVPDPTPTPTVPDESQTSVRSLEAARERRRPRRFNMGVIAAAAAALLLFVGLTALSVGRNSSSDTATQATSDSAVELRAESASSDDTADAMADDEEAMEEEAEAADEPAAESALSEVAPNPTASALLEAPAEGDSASADLDETELFAADTVEDAAADEEEAMDEEESGGSVDNDDAASQFFIGDFTDATALQVELSELTTEQLANRVAKNQDQGLFPGCQPLIQELAETAAITLIGEAFVDNELVEIHVITGTDDAVTIYLVDPTRCSITSVIED